MIPCPDSFPPATKKKKCLFQIICLPTPALTLTFPVTVFFFSYYCLFFFFTYSESSDTPLPIASTSFFFSKTFFIYFYTHPEHALHFFPKTTSLVCFQFLLHVGLLSQFHKHDIILAVFNILFSSLLVTFSSLSASFSWHKKLLLPFLILT